MSEAERFPVRLVYHHNRYSGTLYDVDGNVLRGETGELLNVVNETMQPTSVSLWLRDTKGTKT